MCERTFRDALLLGGKISFLVVTVIPLRVSLSHSFKCSLTFRFLYLDLLEQLIRIFKQRSENKAWHKSEDREDDTRLLSHRFGSFDTFPIFSTRPLQVRTDLPCTCGRFPRRFCIRVSVEAIQASVSSSQGSVS